VRFGSADKPKGQSTALPIPWAQAVMPNRTVFSRVAAADPSAAQAPRLAGIMKTFPILFTRIAFFSIHGGCGFFPTARQPSCY
jgi:hypothetical protein